MTLNEAGSNVAEYTVSELSGALKRTVEDAYGYVRVRGEVSGYRGAHASGHAYFCLKDQTAKLEAVVWRGQFSKLKFKPEEGLEVIATGKLTTYPGSSKYQIVIERMEPSGLGALMALLEERRRKFAAEGLFDQAHKKPLPRLPLTIGVITSPTGAVIRDILHRIADRFPVRVLVWPVRVQGDASAEEVSRAINGFNAMTGGEVPRPDLLIVARGGGSIEDLWAFNEEIVVRAAAASLIPLISAIGHETDWTLLDHVADLRAPTPTAAAELALLVRQDLLVQLSQLYERKLRALVQHNDKRRQSLRGVLRAMPRLDTLLNFPRQRLDHAGEGLMHAAFALNQKKRLGYMRAAQKISLPVLTQRLQRYDERLDATGKRKTRAMLNELKQQRTRYANAAKGLRAAGTGTALARMRERFAELNGRKSMAMGIRLKNYRSELLTAEKLLNSLSYRGVLSRGYAMVRDAQGQPVMRRADALTHDSLAIEFSDGQVEVKREDRLK